MAKEIPFHIRKKIYELITTTELSYADIATQYQIGKGSISRIKQEFEGPKEKVEKKPTGPKLTQKERQRRKKLSKSSVTVHAVKKGEIIAEGFIDVLMGLNYSINDLVEVNEDMKKYVKEIDEKQNSILEMFNSYIDIPDKSDTKKNATLEIFIALQESITKLNDFFPRESLRIKALGELRKQFELFLKTKQEIMDMQAIKGILDAFFVAMDLLPDEYYSKYRDKVIELAPATRTLFTAQESAQEISDSDNNEQEQ